MAFTPPSYLLPRPALCLRQDARDDLDGLLKKAYASPDIVCLEAPSIEPWQMLCHYADHHDVMLHGTGDGTIELFVPRQSNDVTDFGAQKAVYAASDGIWPMFYAILARQKGMGMCNCCINLIDEQGFESEPHYFFSITESVLRDEPFQSGFVYLLPKATFVQDPISHMGELKFKVAHWASLEPVRPIARIPVTPQDFPFLADIRGHDNAVLSARVDVDPDRFPWLDEQFPDIC